MTLIANRRVLFLPMAVCLALSASVPVQAQRESMRSITLVQASRLPADRLAMVYPSTSASNPVILLSPQAGPGDLYEALLLLDVERTISTTHPRRAEVLAIRSGDRSNQDKARLGLYRSFLRELNSAPKRDVGAFRSVKAHDIKVPVRRQARLR